ncbi:flavoprotein [Echinicola pacifica]|uniref:Flavoprotein n=1 Tax=Echinicola pacifica TaxID=346377 RepID=A0A918USU9_9BACT|nr:NAD(P)/FAD-dependent oxidoreductase [Echinicola pacifica]GGZ32664.1 flavoprotein [Echinicola pacifica]
MVTVGIIGGGAAGFFAAIHAAHQGAKVIIFEKSGKTLSKVKVSGGGRCNVTHHALKLSELIKNYPRGEKFMKKAFSLFQVKDTIDWFERHDVTLKVESDGRMFPESDSSLTIIWALENAAKKLGVQVNLYQAIVKITKQETGFLLESNKGDHFIVDKVIGTTGGSPKQDSYQVFAELGHSIVPPIPSLFTFNTPTEPLKRMPGLSVPEALVKLEGTKLSYSGPVLITHWGLSGPAVLKLSAFGAQWLHEQGYEGVAQIRWLADLSEQKIRDTFAEYIAKHPQKKILTNPLFNLPKRLWEHLVSQSGISDEQRWVECGKKQKNILEQHIFCYKLQIKGKTTFKEEFVTAGGISLNEINPRTMESTLVPDLFFAGEVLNIDGITGGFNFQAAWTTGYLAGLSTIKRK